MMKLKHLYPVVLAVLTALIVMGCQWNEAPVRQSLDVDTSTLSLIVGEAFITPWLTPLLRAASRITFFWSRLV